MKTRVSGEAYKRVRGHWLILLRVAPAIPGGPRSTLVLQRSDKAQAEECAEILRKAIGRSGGAVIELAPVSDYLELGLNRGSVRAGGAEAEPLKGERGA